MENGYSITVRSQKSLKSKRIDSIDMGLSFGLCNDSTSRSPDRHMDN